MPGNPTQQAWSAPGGSAEYALEFSRNTSPRLLILPAWFDESNKLRHFTVEVMRALDSRGIASVLPDLPGCNESTAALSSQDLPRWRAAAAKAAQDMACTHVLTLRAGANIPPDLPGWAYAPIPAKSALKALLRARIIASKEAGRDEQRDLLLEQGKSEGLELAGYRLGAAMITQMADAELPEQSLLAQIGQTDLGGAGLWLRMEPDHDAAQADALAARISASLDQ